MDARRVALAVVAAAVALLPGCGGDDQPPRDSLAWFDTPRVIVPPTLKQDRIMQAEVRNDSDQQGARRAPRT